jgi:hypothetical protein
MRGSYLANNLWCLFKTIQQPRWMWKLIHYETMHEKCQVKPSKIGVFVYVKHTCIHVWPDYEDIIGGQKSCLHFENGWRGRKSLQHMRRLLVGREHRNCLLQPRFTCTTFFFFTSSSWYTRMSLTILLP